MIKVFDIVYVKNIFIYMCTDTASGCVRVCMPMWTCTRRYTQTSKVSVRCFQQWLTTFSVFFKLHWPEVEVVFVLFCFEDSLISFDGCFACVDICTPCVPSAREGQKRVLGPPGTGLTGCEPPCECWKLNPDPLKDEPLFLTTEPCLVWSHLSSLHLITRDKVPPSTWSSLTG